MQSLVPDVLDLARETRGDADSSTASIRTCRRKRLYGIQCLRARRLVEAGVRFVEITCPPGASNGTWDQHGNLKKGHEKNALDTDQAIAGLIKDLKARGLLDETLVVWAGEFGRTPHSAGPRRPRPPPRRLHASGWPAAASRAAPSTAPPTSWACTPSRTSARCTTCS